MKHETNAEFIERVMSFSPTGAMSQLVIMTAIERYCESVTRHETKPESWPNMLDWDSWKHTCEYLLKELSIR